MSGKGGMVPVAAPVYQQQQQQGQQRQQQNNNNLYPGQNQQQANNYIGGGGVADAMSGAMGFGGQSGQNTKPWIHLIDDTKPLHGTDLSVFEGRGHFYLRQEIDVAEAIAAQLGCGCIEQSNKYVLFDAQTKEPLLYIRETGVNQLERCCCKPYHSAKLQGFDIRIGQPNANSMVMLVDKPFKLCGGCFACCECCRPEVTAFDSKGAMLGKTVQPFGGNAFTPTVELMDRSNQMYARAEGPKCIFGGMMENCSETVFNFFAKDADEPFGAIKKVKPQGLANQAAQLLTDADAYEFALPVNMPSDQKANFISALVLLEYMFFENGGSVKREGGETKCTLFECYCFGCTVPCECSGGGGGGGGF